MDMKKSYSWLIIIIAVILVLGGITYYTFVKPNAKKNLTAVVVTGANQKRQITQEEYKTIQSQYGKLPGDVSPNTQTMNPELQKNLNTINEVQRINKLNKKQQ